MANESPASLFVVHQDAGVIASGGEAVIEREAPYWIARVRVDHLGPNFAARRFDVEE